MFLKAKSALHNINIIILFSGEYLLQILENFDDFTKRSKDDLYKQSISLVS